MCSCCVYRKTIIDTSCKYTHPFLPACYACSHDCAALRRKGKGDDVSEQQMDAVVRAHNGEQGLNICTLVQAAAARQRWSVMCSVSRAMSAPTSSSIGWQWQFPAISRQAVELQLSCHMCLRVLEDHVSHQYHYSRPFPASAMPMLTPLSQPPLPTPACTHKRTPPAPSHE